MPMPTMVASSGTVFATVLRARRIPRRQEAAAMTMARLEVRVRSLEETQRSLRELPGRMTGLEQRFAIVEDRVEGVERRLEVVERRLDVVESQIVELRTEMRNEFSAIRDALVETNRHMRVLHEEVLARLAAITHG